MKSPNMCYSHDANNNCIIILSDNAGYYKPNYPEGEYDDSVVDALNKKMDITKEQRIAMEICSIAKSNNPDLDWNAHYEKVLGEAIK